MLTVVDADGMTPNGSLIDEIVREGARRMLAAALEAEVNGYLAEVSGQRDEAGRRLVVRNGFHAERMISTSAGPVQVKAPRVNDRRVDEATGERKRFSSAILPPWARKTPKISEVLPLLYLHGLSTGDFVPALEQFLGSAVGLSSATVSRLTAQWSEDHKAFQGRDLSKTDFVYVWADGVHLRVRLDEAKACVLVMVGVRADGSKELIALDAGYRESGESWSSLLRDAARRGMRAPVLAVGDGALGFWKALREVFPGTREQRCWVHKTANVLDALPKSAQPAAKNALADIYNAEDKEHAGAAVRAFAKQYAAKFPKAVAKVVDDQDVLLAFYDYPAEHWIHLRTTNPIESTFATVRLRTKVTRGAGSRAAALAMTFKLIESAQQRWRAVNAPHLVALVRAGGPIRQGRAGGTRTGHRGMTDHAESPLLFLDVDGPLLPFGDGPQPGPSGDASTSHLSRLDPHVGHRLAALPCQLVWATTWEEEANAEIGPRIGLPRLPVVLWPEPSDEHERADQWFGLHWKTRTVVAWADGRPFAWIDDETTDADRDWVAAHHPSRALLHHVMSSRGLTDDDFAVLDQWLRAAWVNHRI